MRHALQSLVCLAVLFPALAMAQGQENAKLKLRARSFFPPEYSNETFVDMRALQNTEYWEALERSPFIGAMKMAFRMNFGCSFMDAQSLHVVNLAEGQWVAEAEDEEEEPEFIFNPQRTVAVISSCRRIDLPIPSRKRGYNSRKAEAMGGFPVVVEGEEDSNWYRQQLFVLPQPKVLVAGDKEALAGVLTGRHRGGVPSPDLMALTAGHSYLAYHAAILPAGEDEAHKQFPFLDREMMTEEDPMRQFLVGLQIDEKSNTALARALLRFQSGDAGPAQIRAFIDEGIAECKQQEQQMPFFIEFRQVLEKLQFQQDGRDLVIALDIGTPDEVFDLGSRMVTGLVGYGVKMVVPEIRRELRRNLGLGMRLPGPQPPGRAVMVIEEQIVEEVEIEEVEFEEKEVVEEAE